MSELPDLVDAIYEAAIVPERWPSVLESLSAVSQSASGSLLVFDGVAAPRWRTTERTRDVLRRFAETDAWRRSERDPERLREVSLGDQYFHCLNDLMTPEQLARDSARQLLEEVGVVDRRRNGTLPIWLQPSRFAREIYSRRGIDRSR